MSQKLRTVFAGTPDFSLPTLNAVADATDLVGVYTQPDRPAGRGRKLVASPIKQRAQELGVPVFQPANFKDEADRNELAALKPDVMIVVAYGLLLPQSVLDMPTHGCVNVHASILPRWRGAAPIQRAIEAGDAQSGVTIMQMEAGLDTGPMLLKYTMPITNETTGGELHDALAALGDAGIREYFAQLGAGELSPEIQDDSQANYAKKLSKAEAEIDWSWPAVKIDRLVRAFNPWPVTFSNLGEKKLRIWSGKVVNEPLDLAPGCIAIHNKQVLVGTSAGQLMLLKVQLPGGKPIDAAAFANGHDLVGKKLGESA